MKTFKARLVLHSPLHCSCDGYGHKMDVGDPSCVVLAVMGLDLTHFRFSKLLYSTVPACTQANGYRWDSSVIFKHICYNCNCSDMYLWSCLCTLQSCPFLIISCTSSFAHFSSFSVSSLMQVPWQLSVGSPTCRPVVDLGFLKGGSGGLL